MLETMLAPTAAATPSHQNFAATGLTPIEPVGANLKIDRDQPLFWEGDEAGYCYKVVSGAVRVCKLTADGRRQVSDFFLPGDLIGFDFDTVHSCTAEAIVDSIVRRYPKASVEHLISGDPRAARQMLAFTCDRLAMAQTQLMLLGRMTATERLATFLIGLAGRSPSQQRPDQKVMLPMTRADVADHLGLTVETISRVLSRMKRDGVIDVPDAHSIVVHDWDDLQDLSEDCDA